MPSLTHDPRYTMYATLSPRANWQAFKAFLCLLRARRRLTLELARRELTERHAGQVFGSFWTIAQPITLMLVYVFVFRFIFALRIGGTTALPLDYTAYLLSGLVPWLAFQDAMTKAGSVVIANSNLVKQVVFPIEVLPIKGVVATVMTESILLSVVLAYIVLSQRTVHATFALIPYLLLLQALAMAGISYGIAALSVFFRDVRELVQIYSTIGVYLIPAFYLPESVPSAFRLPLLLNPFSHVTWCFQDALYFGRIEHPWSWLLLTCASVFVLVTGYRFFRKLSGTFASAL